MSTYTVVVIGFNGSGEDLKRLLKAEEDWELKEIGPGLFKYVDPENKMSVIGKLFLPVVRDKRTFKIIYVDSGTEVDGQWKEFTGKHRWIRQFNTGYRAGYLCRNCGKHFTEHAEGPYLDRNAITYEGAQ